MKTHASKTRENKSRSISQIKSGRQSSENPGLHFTDNRPETVTQRKLNDMANNRQHAQQAAQLKAISNSGSAVQLKSPEEEELLQGKFKTVQRKVVNGGEREKRNNTGLPDGLKTGIENLSGISMDDVNVHFNSAMPEQLQALAYAQGTDIHVAPGQEQHLPHEAWHIVQQKKGRVKPTMQMKGKVNVNDNEGLEREADRMGAKALRMENREERHDAGCTCPACTGSSTKSDADQSVSGRTPVAQLVKCPECKQENGHAPGCKRHQQEQRGLRMGRGMELYGAEINRIPHAAGGVASAGSAREATHSHGNEQAKTQAVNALVAEGVPRNKITQSSQVRSAIRGKEKAEAAQEAREEKKRAGKAEKRSDAEMAQETFGYSDEEWDRLSEEEQREQIKMYREHFKDKKQ